MPTRALRTLLPVSLPVMPRLVPRLVLLALVVVLAGAAGGLAGAGGTVVAASAPAPDPPPVTANEFIPEDRPLDDCISSLPKPGCGSEAHGGWRQGLVFAVLALGLAFIGWRIVRGVRHSRRVPSSP